MLRPKQQGRMLLKKPSPFFSYLLTRSFFTLAIHMQATLLAWFVYQISHDPFDLGLTGLAEIIPFVAMLLLGGALADRFRRKKLMAWSLFGYLMIGLGLWFLAWKKEQGNEVSLMLVYFLIFLTGLSRAILSPAQNALLGQLVPREELTRASVWSSAIYHIGAVGGPAIGGIAYAYAGPTWAFGGVAVLFGLAWASVLKIPDPGKPEITSSDHDPLWKRMKAGLVFVYRHQLLFPGMMMDMVAVLFGGAVAVLPLFADQILHTGAEGLGWLRAAPALGSLCTALFLLRHPPGKGAGKWLLACVFGFGITNLGFALSTSFWISFSFLFIGGLLDNVSAIIRMSLVQLYTPDAMKGRVSAVNSIFIGSSNELGAFESGLAAKVFGLVPSVIYGSWITFATVGITTWKARALRNLNF